MTKEMIKKSIYEVLFATIILLTITGIILGILLIDSYMNEDIENKSNNISSINTSFNKSNNVSITNESLNNKNFNLSSNLNTSSSKIYNSNWCESNTNKIINNKEYKIIGLTTLQGKSVCKAVIQTLNSETIRYWNEDETIVSESSSSYSKDGSYAEVSSNISIPN